MLIAFFARHVLRESRETAQAHLVRVKEQEIDRLADVAVGFGPRFAHFKNFKGRKFETPAIHDGGNALEQFSSMLDADAAPMVERFARRRDRGFRLRNSSFSHGADDLIGRAWIDGVNEAAGPNFLAVDDNGIFLTQTAAHFAESVPHFFLAAAVDEIYERRVFVRVSGRSVERGAVAGMGGCRAFL